MTALLPTYTPFPFVLSHGVRDQVFATDGRIFWDFYGGHCVASTGHSHPRVVAAIHAQAQSLLFYSTAGALPLRERAAAKLIEFSAGSGMQHVFFCNSGAEANENALKLAHKLTGRPVIMTLKGGWHGRSLACLSATDDAKITQPYSMWLPPSRAITLNDFDALAAADFSDVCAVIIEPIQSLAGVCPAAKDYLQALRAKTALAGSLLIFDEIQTGVGRLGAPFAANVHGVQPDIITSAKGLASGVPIGAVLMQAGVAAKITPGDMGSTFGGGPLACAALLATLDVIEQEGMMTNARSAGAAICAGLHALGITTRGTGLLLGVEHPQAGALKPYLFDAGILVGGSNAPNVLRLMPPLNLSSAAIAFFLHAVQRFQSNHS
jgi:acetylornithine/N-succinyldiaminopimelate aminotransferase